MKQKGLILILALGVAIRVALWFIIPATQYAGDEDAYMHDGLVLAATGVQIKFWPPGTIWLIAFLKTIGLSENVKAFRLVWIALDLGVASLVWTLARRVKVNPGRATAFYLLYLPAISFAEFVTSEVPTVLLLLLGILFITADKVIPAGLATAAAVLARTNVAGLLLTLPLVLKPKPKAFTFAAIAFLSVLAWPMWIYSQTGTFAMSTNSDLNIYIGNVDYQEDLNLFHPWPTDEQLRYRQEVRAGRHPVLQLSNEEMRRMGVASIVENKMLFLRRSLGRFAKLFAPRVAQLRLTGQETLLGPKEILSPITFGLLAITNLQWLFVLVFGTAGLLVLKTYRPLFLAVIAGCVLMCLVAISQPRYSFPFEPFLIISAIYFVSDWRERWRELNKPLFFGLMLFFAWTWCAWAIFMVSSRMTLT